MRRIVTLVAAIAGLTLAVPAAHAQEHSTDVVRPFVSVAGVPIRDTPGQIRARFGAPASIQREHGRVASYGYGFGAIGLQIEFDTRHRGDRAFITAVALTPGGAGRLHTVDGIHLGTPAATLRVRLRTFKTLQCTPGLGCTITRGGDGDPADPGSSSTVFTAERGRVEAIGVASQYNDG